MREEQHNQAIKSADRYFKVMASLGFNHDKNMYDMFLEGYRTALEDYESAHKPADQQ